MIQETKSNFIDENKFIEFSTKNASNLKQMNLTV